MPVLQEKAASTRSRGNAAEDQALAHLQAQGLRLLVRNYRTPGRRNAEIDLILRDAAGTVVFVEVRSRQRHAAGGVAASINWHKRQRIRRAAQHYLLGWRQLPPVRFGVVLIEQGQLRWLVGAFDAEG